MSLSSRVLTRVLVIGAVVALTGSLGALPVAGQTADDAKPGPAVPGLTVAKVSGEAFGGEAELNIKLDTSVRGGSLDLQALTAAVLAGDSAAASTILEDAGIDTSAGAQALVDVFSGEVGPDPEVELPPEGGGPLKDSEGSLKLTIEGDQITFAEDLEVETQGATGPTGFARTEAKAENIDSSEVGIYFADKIESECSADLSGVRGSTRIEDGQFVDLNLLDLVDIPEHPDKNEVLVDDTVDVPIGGTFVVRVTSFLIVNEQDKDENSITVTGAREHTKFEFIDVTNPAAPVVFETFDFQNSYAQSHCDIHPEPVVVVVEPKFTG